MIEAPTPTKIPKIGFVSLDAPKALTDSGLILTQLSAEGYQTSKTFDGADLVIVNTCGFIDDAVREKPGHHRRGPGRKWQGHRHRLPGRARARAVATWCVRCTPACLPSPGRTPRKK